MSTRRDFTSAQFRAKCERHDFTLRSYGALYSPETKTSYRPVVDRSDIMNYRLTLADAIQSRERDRRRQKAEFPRFDTLTPEDRELIRAIVKRVHARIPDIDTECLFMDIEATHERQPLRLVDLLTADDFNFLHDTLGIQEHIDRTTGEMLDCFLPRFTVPQPETEEEIPA